MIIHYMKYQKLLDLIKQSKRILVTSHLSPDSDAIGSSLFTYNILKENFKDKEVSINLESGVPEPFVFLQNINEVKTLSTKDCLEQFKPDLFIITDGMNIGRVTVATEQVYQYLEENNVKRVIIDHHNEDGKDDVDLYINNKCSSTSEEVYKIFYEDLQLKLPEGYGDIVMVGILGDTGRFLFPNLGHRETFRVVSDLIDSGVVIEELSNRFGNYKKEALLILSELLINTTVEEGYTYTYLSDAFMAEHVIGKMNVNDFKGIKEQYLSSYLRKIENNRWGFLVTRELKQLDKHLYGGSFRAMNNTVDTTVFTTLMGGGGHKAASGFSFEAENVQEALKIIKQVIKDNLTKAIEGGKN